MTAGPTFSVLIGVWNTDPRALRQCVESVVAQTYPHWELFLVDDGSTRRDTRAALQRLAGLDPRIRVGYSRSHRGISASQNDALAMARGEFAALVEHDDILEPDALKEVAAVVAAHPDADLIYTDEDVARPDGTEDVALRKPGWSPTFLLAAHYLNHLTVYRRTVALAVGGFREDYELAQDWDLALRVTAITSRVHHVPKVLYHWIRRDGSAEHRADAQYWRRRCHEDNVVARYGPEARTVDAPLGGNFHVVRPIAGNPRVSIVIPTAGQRALVDGQARTLVLRCLDGLRNHTAYRNYEVICVVDPRTPPRVRAELQQACADDGTGRITLVNAAGPFDFSDRVNLGAEHARGEHLLLLNDDTFPLRPDWLTAMVSVSQEPGVGVVGAKLYFTDGRIEHVGVIIAPDGYPNVAYRGYPAAHPGNMGTSLLEHDAIAATGACQMSRTELFRELGGYGADFPLNWGDIDYCLRARAAGYQVVITPTAELEHREAASRPRTGTFDELERWSAKWGHLRDPYWREEAELEQSFFARVQSSGP